MRHILIVDDDSAILQLFEQFLQRKGFSTSVASDGFEAIIQLKKRTPDLLITDIIMDGMDGLALIREVRKKEIHMPVIAISGGRCVMSVDFELRAEKTGADEFLEKPIRLTDLLQSIQALLDENLPSD